MGQHDPEYDNIDSPPMGGVDLRRAMLDTATQKTRFTLIKGILSHPNELPSLRELELINPSLGRTTIHEHLEKLIAVGVVERVENQDTIEDPDIPSKFYGLTDQGQDVMAATGLVDTRETLKQYYNSLNKTDEHLRHENAPRP
jgi:DNA-binding HxlR family transcriptional regulator